MFFGGQMANKCEKKEPSTISKLEGLKWISPQDSANTCGEVDLRETINKLIDILIDKEKMNEKNL